MLSMASEARRNGVPVALVVTSILSPSNAWGQDAVQTQEIEELKSLIHEHALDLELDYPFTPSSIDHDPEIAFVEYALEGAISSFSSSPVRVAVASDEVFIEFLPEPEFVLDESWRNASPEVLRGAVRDYLDGRIQRAHEEDTVLQDAVRGAFEHNVGVSVQEGSWSGDPFDVLQAVGDVETRDLLSAMGSVRLVDPAGVWHGVKQVLAERDIAIYGDRITDDGKYELSTGREGSQDEDWLYQTYQTVAMWDPYVSDDNANRFLRIEVLTVVRRRKELGPFRDIKRNGPFERELLEGILDGLAGN